MADNPGGADKPLTPPPSHGGDAASPGGWIEGSFGPDVVPPEILATSKFQKEYLREASSGLGLAAIIGGALVAPETIVAGAIRAWRLFKGVESANKLVKDIERQPPLQPKVPEQGAALQPESQPIPIRVVRPRDIPIPDESYFSSTPEGSKLSEFPHTPELPRLGEIADNPLPQLNNLPVNRVVGNRVGGNLRLELFGPDEKVMERVLYNPGQPDRFVADTFEHPIAVKMPDGGEAQVTVVEQRPGGYGWSLFDASHKLIGHLSFGSH